MSVQGRPGLIGPKGERGDSIGQPVSYITASESVNETYSG